MAPMEARRSLCACAVCRTPAPSNKWSVSQFVYDHLLKTYRFSDKNNKTCFYTAIIHLKSGMNNVRNVSCVICSLKLWFKELPSVSLRLGILAKILVLGSIFGESTWDLGILSNRSRLGMYFTCIRASKICLHVLIYGHNYGMIKSSK